MNQAMSGVIPAMLTLYDANSGVDAIAMSRLGRWLLDQGCDSLLVFGTTGEGPSVSVSEKIATVNAMIKSGIPPQAIIVAANNPSLTDAITLTAALGKIGSAALVLPPYFFRSASSEGVRNYFEQILTRTRDEETDVYLYHFPDMSTVVLDPDAMATLIKAHPGRLLGVKDTSGDVNSMRSWTRRCSELSVFTGHDHLVRSMVKAGGGVMTATTGLAPGLVREVYDDAIRRPSVETAAEKRLNTLWTEILLKVPLTAGIKQIFAEFTDDARWLRIRAPLEQLGPAAATDMLKRFNAVDDGATASAIRAMPRIFD